VPPDEPVGSTGRLSRLRRTVEDNPPPGPFRPGFWRSPLRGPWLTAVLGSILLVGVTILFVTGLLSYAAYNPELAALLIGVGIGAIIQVIVQLVPAIRDRAGRALQPASVAGILTGVAILYATGLLVSA